MPTEIRVPFILAGVTSLSVFMGVIGNSWQGGGSKGGSEEFKKSKFGITLFDKEKKESG